VLYVLRKKSYYGRVQGRVPCSNTDGFFPFNRSFCYLQDGIMSKPNESIDKVEDSQSSKVQSDFFQTWGPSRLRLLFLLPMSLAYLWIVLVLSVLLYQYSEDTVDKDVLRISVSAQEFYREGIIYDTRALQAVMHTLQNDKVLNELLAAKDIKKLLAHATPLYNDLNQDFSITHMYFTGIDRVNLLRVHDPMRSGGMINRITTQQAVETGQMASGVELGALGTFTLRLVSPWYDESKQLIGYVEIGMETDQVLNQIRDLFGIQLQILVKKEFLDREKWESGMRTLGRTPVWDRFSKFVINETVNNDISMLALESLTGDRESANDSALELMSRGFSYRVLAIPLQDVAGRDVAEMVLISDVSIAENSARKTAGWGILIAFIVGGGLLIFFYWLVGRIGRHIEQDHVRLEELATHDGLTELYNHRMFYHFLSSEIERVNRYEHPVSLLMLDIDLFKKVNDTYGHRAGDMILHGLSELLMNQMRKMDLVCRYGGEEIGIILPEVKAEVAIDIANRLCKTVEEFEFDIGDGELLAITVSIGVTTCTIGGEMSVSGLVTQSDEALYKAKEAGRNQACVFE